jgi:thioredoxin 1
MNKTGKIIIVVALIVIVGIVIALKQQGENSVSEPAVVSNSISDTETGSELENSVSSQTAENSEKLPRLVDLGAAKCVPCKMMKPILDDLKQNYNEQFKVTFIDVWKNQEQAEKYNVKMIPTQIFFDADGTELFRHEGFYSKEDILGKWNELGIEFEN